MKQDVTKILGYILLTPSLISVLMFLSQLFNKDNKMFNIFMSTIWTGDIKFVYLYETSSATLGQGGAGGYTSALPLYFGLMAIAGAYLIKDRK
jgi:hypothetical protein